MKKKRLQVTSRDGGSVAHFQWGVENNYSRFDLGLDNYEASLFEAACRRQDSEFDWWDSLAITDTQYAKVTVNDDGTVRLPGGVKLAVPEHIRTMLSDDTAAPKYPSFGHMDAEVTSSPKAEDDSGAEACICVFGRSPRCSAKQHWG